MRLPAAIGRESDEAVPDRSSGELLHVEPVGARPCSQQHFVSPGHFGQAQEPEDFFRWNERDATAVAAVATKGYHVARVTTIPTTAVAYRWIFVPFNTAAIGARTPSYVKD